jgi:hypothetical protein
MQTLRNTTNWAPTMSAAQRLRKPEGANHQAMLAKLENITPDYRPPAP